MNLKILTTKKILIPVGSIVFFLSFLSNIPLNSLINQQISKNIPRKCSSINPTIIFSLFPIPSVYTEKPINVSPNCSGLSKTVKIEKVRLSNRGLSFNPIGLKFNVDFELKTHRPIEFSLALGVDSIKLIMNQVKLSSEILSEFIDLPLDINGGLDINLITSISKKGIKELEANILSTNLSLPPQMISGFNIPQINASPFQVDASITNSKTLKINAVEIGKKESDLYLIGKGEVNDFNNSSKSSVNVMSTLALKKELKTQFSFINLLLGNPNDQGEYKFQVSGRLNSPKVKTLN